MANGCESQAGGLPNRGKPWLAAYTRPRHEQKVLRYWQSFGFDAFLPTYKSWRNWSDRRKVLQLPLFPGYVFVRITEEERQSAVQAPGLLWFVHNARKILSIDEQELHAIRRLLDSGFEYGPLASVSVGDEVEIVSGAMTGQRGCLLSKDPGSIVLRISAINGFVRVKVPDPSWLAPVARHRVRSPALSPADHCPASVPVAAAVEAGIPITFISRASINDQPDNKSTPFKSV
mgnify:CR=1 FL=1